MSLPVLDAIEQRILGSLLEKQTTVPASYPLSLNALRQACNQTSSRDPLMELDDATLIAALKGLKDSLLVKPSLGAAGSRTLRYGQLLSDRLGVDPAERALLTVLLLRGPQSPGELKSRTERLAAFASKDEVTATLGRLAALEPPLVTSLPRARGQQETRWAHLLGPVPGVVDDAPAPTVDREAVLAGGPRQRDARVAAAYDAIAAAYAGPAAARLERNWFDRALIERIGAEADGPVMDLGCGPGHIAAFLAARGVEAHGVDASPRMIEEARARHPGVPFEVGRFDQMLRPRDAPAWGAIIAWFAFIHLAPSELAGALRLAGNTLRPGGAIVVALEAGSGVVRHEELDGVPIDVDVVEHEFDEVLAAIGEAGLTVDEWYVRSAHADETFSHGFFVIARRPQRAD